MVCAVALGMGAAVGSDRAAAPKEDAEMALMATGSEVLKRQMFEGTKFIQISDYTVLGMI